MKWKYRKFTRKTNLENNYLYLTLLDTDTWFLWYFNYAEWKNWRSKYIRLFDDVWNKYNFYIHDALEIIYWEPFDEYMKIRRKIVNQ